MGAFDAIQPLSPLRLETRTDLAALQPVPIPIAEIVRESRTDAVDTGPVQATPSVHPLTATGLSQSPTPPTASSLDIAIQEAEPALSVPWLATPLVAAATTSVEASGATETAAAPQKPADAAPLPYGPDPERVRHLIDWFVSRNEFLPVTFAYRQAGDLRETVPARSAGRAVAAARAVSALYQTD
ncbi:hypothetical protein [Aureimonas glaciei]|uniref:Uncharacterized protein n=1 Tax=Aureimonas glaciei TaxID=1776957 RepID=A0A916XVS0_9HYPH|nr:hypothetical protein [Aureimonas glaciei]GGD16626.1 hypothetical protein GCM10011335_19270 [Aureimonas glaciei]